MVCPTCKKPLEAKKKDNVFFPFCSERCQLIDLGAWLEGKYVVPGTDSVAEPGDPQQDPE